VLTASQRKGVIAGVMVAVLVAILLFFLYAAYETFRTGTEVVA